MALYPAEDGPIAKPNPRRNEGASQKVRTRALVFMVVALVGGVGAAWLITAYVQKRSALANVASQKVVVAAVDLTLATTLRAEALTVVEWPKQIAPANSFQDMKDLDGRVVSMPVLKGEPLVEGRLSEKGKGEGMAAIIPPTMRAMTVKVNEASGVGGFIHPNDQVDVITTMQVPINGRSGEQEYRSKIVIQNVKVLAVGEEMVTKNSKPVKVPVVTLLVNPEESERLALSSSHGELQLTMRAQTDNEPVATVGITPPELLRPGMLDPPVKKHSSSSGRRPSVAAAPGAPKQEVVEILRGDKFEERKMRNKESE